MGGSGTTSVYVVTLFLLFINPITYVRLGESFKNGSHMIRMDSLLNSVRRFNESVPE